MTKGKADQEREREKSIEWRKGKTSPANFIAKSSATEEKTNKRDDISLSRSHRATTTKKRWTFPKWGAKVIARPGERRGCLCARLVLMCYVCDTVSSFNASQVGGICRQTREKERELKVGSRGRERELIVCVCVCVCAIWGIKRTFYLFIYLVS